ncbi:hypothetical protein EDB82DRAFT_110594 [Fusarium venenatum]|uniref:uncharacterized protein n=1 Tax=Fusarium venenatum TaxID=56646 RepID=UPI001D412B39|nr:hypothetical protein EDB82DRAFT_110594 [Fusarium venenatum]
MSLFSVVCIISYDISLTYLVFSTSALGSFSYRHPPTIMGTTRMVASLILPPTSILSYVCETVCLSVCGAEPTMRICVLKIRRACFFSFKDQQAEAGCRRSSKTSPRQPANQLLTSFVGSMIC